MRTNVLKLKVFQAITGVLLAISSLKRRFMHYFLSISELNLIHDNLNGSSDTILSHKEWLYMRYLKGILWLEGIFFVDVCVP